MIGLLCLGKPDFDAIEPFREDEFFAQSMGVKLLPSSPTLRQRMDSAKGAFNDVILEKSAGMVGQLAPVVTPCHGRFVALDIDVSPFDNSGTKKGGDKLDLQEVHWLCPHFCLSGERRLSGAFGVATGK
jgi:hypothetical protein